MKKSFILLISMLPLFAAGQYRLASKSGTPKKMVTTTKYDPGFVVLKNGKKLEGGDISIKVINSDTVEIRYKTDAGKEKYKRSDVASFGLNAKSGAEVAGKERNDPMRNLQEGYVIMKDGERWDGRVALRNKAETGIAADDKKDFFIYENDTDGAKEFQPTGVDKIVQVIDGKEVTHYGFETVLVEEQANGGLIYVRNPFPTTYNKMATAMAAQAAYDLNEDMDEAAAREGATVEGDGIDVGKVYYKEYLVKKSESADWITVTRDNYKEIVPALLKGCKIEKSLMKYRVIYRAFDYYAENCGK